MLPPGLRLRRERGRAAGAGAAAISEDAVRALAEDYNARVEAFWRQPAESRWAAVPGLADVEALVDALVGEQAAARPSGRQPPPEPRRRRWRRRG